jgi:RHS repeat-associated protein
MDYSPFGVLLDGRNFGSDQIRHGFGGMEKDDEISGNGNSYSTELRQYSPRLGRWISLDSEMKKFPNKSPFNAYSDNPLIFIDPLGDADFYFHGKWVGTDGKTDNLIGIVDRRKVKKEINKITKKGHLVDYGDLNNGDKTKDGILIIHSDVLTHANEILTTAMNEGKAKEFSQSLIKDGNTFVPTGEVLEGTEIDLRNPKEIATSHSPDGDVNIHSHLTGEKLFDGTVFGMDAYSPSTREEALKKGKDPNQTDEADFGRFKMNIIVGKNGKAGGSSQDGITKIRKRDAFINIFGNSINDRKGKIIQKEATKILKNYKGKRGTSRGFPTPPSSSKPRNSNTTSGN